MGFHNQICSILRFSWSILLKCGVYLRTSSSKNQMLLLEKNMFHQFWLFCVYIWPSWPFVLPSVFCLSFVNNFTSSVRNFCRWVADVIPRESSLDVFAGYRETSSAAKSEEKRLFSQAMSSLNWFFWWVQICLSSCLQGLFSFFLGTATNLNNRNNNTSKLFPNWPLTSK